METIYTIPVNETFESCAEAEAPECPFCALYSKLEENELELILGASMMEPDVRIKTNEQGFCRSHYDMMLTRKNRLGLALMLQSHLDKVRGDIEPSKLTEMIKGSGNTAQSKIGKLSDSCYVCSRIEFSINKMFENAALLWGADKEFKAKLRNQKMFCLPHFARFTETARNLIPKKQFGDFYSDLSKVTFEYFDSLRDDIDLFCKKFDYRYQDEPWGNAKDSPDRAVRFLSSDQHN